MQNKLGGGGRCNLIWTEGRVMVNSIKGGFMVNLILEGEGRQNKFNRGGD